MKGNTDLKIALAILIPSFLIGAAIVGIVQAKPHERFCADFNNDDGSPDGSACDYKSKGECKKDGPARAGDSGSFIFSGCRSPAFR